MEFGDRVVYFPRDATDEHFAALNRAVEQCRICTIIGPEGSGKTALFNNWRSSLIRPKDILYIYLDDGSDNYRSMTHMVYARILEEIYDLARPWYGPQTKSQEEDTNRFGKRQLERLRKEVRYELNQRPISAIAIDRTEYIDQYALDAALGLRLGPTNEGIGNRRALLLIGQPQTKLAEDKRITTWLKKRGSARAVWLERIDLICPSLIEFKGTKQRPGIPYRLMKEGIKVIVPQGNEQAQVNQQLGEWIEQTQGNFSSLERLIRLLDDEAETVPGSEYRHITLAVIERVRTRLGKLERP
jgi:energy-coupling factor transporter ATP-binding protein EcfA2